MTDPHKPPNDPSKPTVQHQPVPAAVDRSWTGFFMSIFSRRMLVVFLQGFSCGVPLLLAASVLQAWLTDECVRIEHVSLFGLVMLPYTLKFLWAPLLDRYAIPFFGRRRGWLLIFQVGLAAAIMMVGQNDPLGNPWLLAVSAMIMVFFSATQDILVDAHRRESLADHELGLGSSLYVQAYRFGMIAASGFGLVLADQYGFEFVYVVMGVLIMIGVFSTLIANEPIVPSNRPTTLQEAVIEPFKEFFSRRDAWLVLLFVLLYKFGDAMAGHLTTPFFLDYGYSKTEIGVIAKVFGFAAILVGTFVGALIMLRIGLFRALVVFGVFQMVSTGGFAYMSIALEEQQFTQQKEMAGDDLLMNLKRNYKSADEECVPNSLQDKLAQKAERKAKQEQERTNILSNFDYRRWLLAIVIAIENLAAGMGTAAFMAFMASMADKRFTATQYALLTSLMAFSSNILNAPAGYFVNAFGWNTFFIFCTVVALPGLLLLWRFRSWIGKEPKPEPQTDPT